MQKVLFICTHRLNRSPSQRFRFEQYLQLLQLHHINYDVSPLLSEEDDRIYYSNRNYVQKLGILIHSFKKRKMDITQSSDYGIIFIQREAFFLGPAYFEKQFKRNGSKIIFDFDDAIWQPNVSDANKRFAWIKFPSKIHKIIAISDIVIAGNNYLANYSRQYNSAVRVIPTTIDTNYHKREFICKNTDRICIGWTGSHTTIPYFNMAIPALVQLKKKYGNKISFKIIGDTSYLNTELGIRGIKWSAEDEIAQLSEIDIGIMPLPDNDWAKGKCGLKGLQYMALEIPCIMSPIGVNTEIITEGINGFLAKDDDEWVRKISDLIEQPALRKRIGLEARKTVEEKYSVNSQKENYINIFKTLLT